MPNGSRRLFVICGSAPVRHISVPGASERWFRDLKHNCIYQTEYGNMRELRHVIAQYVERYNFRRLHSSLDYCTPAEWYFSGINEANAPTDKMMKWAS